LEPCHDLPRVGAAGRKETTMMPTSKKAFLATAAALALALGLLGSRPSAAQDDRSTRESVPANQATAQGEPSNSKPEGGAPAETAPAPEVAPTPKAASAPAPAPVAPETPTAPPKHLKKVGDHWTPYSPPDPESFAAGATLHVIAPGETLWGLADLTYNNPWLWPQLWNENRYITDSHWIYPGDPLLVPPRPVVVTQAGPEARPGVAADIVAQGQEGAPPTNLEPLTDGEGGAAPIEEPLAAEAPSAPSELAAPARHAAGEGASRASHAIVDADELRCSGFIRESTDRSTLFIGENEEPRYQRISTGSLVYLSRGQDDARVQAGASFSIVENEGTVLHPSTGRTLGEFIRRIGEVRVIKVLADTALATVTFACDEIRVGDSLIAVDVRPVPARPIPAFDRTRVERNGKPTGVVVHTRDTAVAVAAGDLVQIDLGHDDGLASGDFLTAFDAVESNRKGHMPDYHYKFGNEEFSSADLHYDSARTAFPSMPVATLVVVSTESHTATAKIVYSIREVPVGMMVEVN
jgi:hypothetical protein